MLRIVASVKWCTLRIIAGARFSCVFLSAFSSGPWDSVNDTSSPMTWIFFFRVIQHKRCSMTSNIKKWITHKKVDLDSDSCAQFILNDKSKWKMLNDQFGTFKMLRDKGVLVRSSLSWCSHIKERLWKVHKLF